MVSFGVVMGDITRFPAEAIVNAANRYLEHGGGVAYAIAKAAAGDVREYIRISKEAMHEQLGKDSIEHGEVVVTPALGLERYGIKYVIHAVGPYCGGRWDEDKKEKLRKAILGALRKAEELGVKTIAFPAISAGIYGCPLEGVVRTFQETVEEFSQEAKSLEKVYLVLYSERDYDRARAVLENGDH
ncbi:histone macroH2A-related protein (C-terminus) [Thermococcus onnurineus NA1]|uniref:Histone macroH2A-related protein (C-terminus) n=1 Tax=Thermococcus onnurineus (strain NA1) TaxID=523850 RepID=B6YUG0_THEON|nr:MULTISPECIES: [protein ADP-ribosylglutamate] hydrolase [Thermococcus]ACJ17145.1 histone macroH2A-related protein (C-terminus) [Thermococcus onnurineus NA1]NJE46127.1 [protein ADP-ribosylglutamate] hydrolase [Thermococcus sp. GR7]NJE78237.1 [protein ADP-ribosylglutamate] hydrolase [Thermococcus sp. GR4]NJF22324.1 [protein ADP-ribosylglutamate] hydrolase [Thermococcus sp. GR5]